MKNEHWTEVRLKDVCFKGVGKPVVAGAIKQFSALQASP